MGVRTTRRLLAVAPLVIAASLFTGPPAQAAVTLTTNDLAAFLQAGGAPVLVTFDRDKPGSLFSAESTGGLTVTAPEGAARLVVVRADDTFTPVAPGAPPDLVHKLPSTSGDNVLSPGGPELRLADPAFDDDRITLTFDPPVSAVGFDVVYQSFDSVQGIAVTVLAADGTVLATDDGIPEGATNPADAPGGSGFVGFIADAAEIASVTIVDGDGDAVFTDGNIGLDTIRVDPASRSRVRLSTSPAIRQRQPAFAGSLAPPQQVDHSPKASAISLAVGSLLLALVFPAELFNATWEANYEVVAQRFRRLQRRPRRSWPVPLVFGLCLVGAGALQGQLDREMGFGRRYVAFILGAALAGLTRVAIPSFTGDRLDREGRVGLRLEPLPLGLVVAAVSVGVSWLARFEPGYFYGAIGGFVPVIALTSRREGRRVAITLAATVALGLSAGLLLGWLDVLPIVDATFPEQVVSGTLSAIYIGALSGLMFAMLPLTFLPGRQLRQWSHKVWLAAFVLSAGLYIKELVEPAKGTKGSVRVVVVLFLAFGSLSVGFWLYCRGLRRTPRLVPAPATAPSPPVVREAEPWPGYDGMTAKQITALLAEADDERRGVVHAYEAANKGRLTILRASATDGHEPSR